MGRVGGGYGWLGCAVSFASARQVDEDCHEEDVKALESLAGVCAAQGRPRQAAVLLGAAHTARTSASAHMRPIEPPDEELRRSLKAILGTAAFEPAHAEGERTSPTQALPLASTPTW